MEPNTKPTDSTSSQPRFVQDYTKMEDDYGREIDRLMKENKLTDEQFQTYTRGYCWYCGRPFSSIDGARHLRTLKLTKQQRRTEGIKKITTTYTRTVQVPECSECKAYHTLDDKKTNKLGVAGLIVGYLIVAGVIAYLYNTSADPESVLIIGIILSISLCMVVYFVGVLVLMPFIGLYNLITRKNKRNPDPVLRSERYVPQVIQARNAGFS